MIPMNYLITTHMDLNISWRKFTHQDLYVNEPQDVSPSVSNTVPIYCIHLKIKDLSYYKSTVLSILKQDVGPREETLKD